MSVGSQGHNLIFLISQPRAGSTLLQRILGGHPDIQTTSEPWLMLHPLYALRPDGYQAEYDEHWARTALHGFLQTLPGGEDEYFESVRRMCRYLYKRALPNSGQWYFLDKTPRYYFVIPEIVRVFPKAHYIIMLRNPLAVLYSILTTWVKGSWFSLYGYRHDLIQAPRLLLEGIDVSNEQGIVVHYEQLVRNPEEVVRRICRELGIDFVAEMIEYGHHNLPRWRLGDQGEVYQHARPTSRNGEKWVLALDDPQIWRLSNNYLQLLGPETIERMGYRYEELQQVLERHRPRRASLRLTFSLARLLEMPVEERSTWDRCVMRCINSIQRRGIRGTAISAVKKASRALPDSK